MKRFLALSLFTLGFALQSVACSAPPTRVRTTWIADASRKALTVVVNAPYPVTVYSYEIGFDRRRGVFAHPPSEIHSDRIAVEPGSKFRTAISILPEALAQGSDGAGFRAECRDPLGHWRSLVEVDLRPASGEQALEWRELEADLDPCSRPETKIRLLTECGAAGHCEFDWAVWAEPRVEVVEPISVRSKEVVILISIDTQRADRLGVYGAPRPTSPQLSRLAGDGIVFEHAFAPAPWTTPSHATMLTSLDPSVHRAGLETAIAPAATLVSELFRAAGWRTAAFLDALPLGERFGFDRGFDTYDNAPFGELRGADIVLDHVTDWLQGADSRPAFLFWHLFDVHGPYGAARPFGGSFRSRLTAAEAAGEMPFAGLPNHIYLQLERFRSLPDLVAGYDEGAAFADDALGRLFDFLRAADVYDDATILVTADHGESLYDHRIFVGHTLFLTDDEVRIPMILKLPRGRQAGARESEPVALVDVAPTLLEAAGLEIPVQFQGKSLLGRLGRRERRGGAAVYGESDSTGATYVRTLDWKYISSSTVDPVMVLSQFGEIGEELSSRISAALGEQLYDLRADPGETHSVLDSAPSVLEAMRRLDQRRRTERARLRARIGEGERAAPLTLEELQRLQALGYLNP